MKKKNSVPILQKICAFLFLGITITTFICLRNQKIENTKAKNIELTTTVESLLKDSLEFLYNSDDISIPPNKLIHDDFKSNLITKFLKPNSLAKESNLTLSTINLSKNRIYRTRKNSVKYLIYDGIIELKWTLSSSNIETDSEKKNIIGYIIQEGEDFYIADIELSSIKN